MTSQLLRDLMNLDSASWGAVSAEYIWIGGSGLDPRTKPMTFNQEIKSPADLPSWSYDGSTTSQADGHDSEIILKPIAIYKDPFRRGKNVLVMCDKDKPDGTPLKTNKKCDAAKISETKVVADEDPWYGIEQEYTYLGEKDRKSPSGLPANRCPCGQVMCDTEKHDDGTPLETNIRDEAATTFQTRAVAEEESEPRLHRDSSPIHRHRDHYQPHRKYNYHLERSCVTRNRQRHRRRNQ